MSSQSVKPWKSHALNNFGVFLEYVIARAACSPASVINLSSRARNFQPTSVRMQRKEKFLMRTVLMRLMMTVN